MSESTYDAIIVGARVAGSPLARLLALKGYRVLLVDRATFPSDTMSTHQIQIPGSVLLKRWGLLDRILATSPGVAHHVRFDVGDVVLEGDYPMVDGISAVISPRRYLLDKILVDAAVEAGTELREGFITEELLWDEGRVTGIRGRLTSGGTFTERAKIVIGADGKHSMVAKAVNAPIYDDYAPLTCAYYAYWDGIPQNGGELYIRPRRAIGAWPTNDNRTMIYAAWPASEFQAIRENVEKSYMASIDSVPFLAERVHHGQRAERIVGTADLPNFYRKPYGPGWALVGDAGLTRDPISAQGIGDAFRDADLLAEAIDAGFAGRQPLEAALSDYELKRNADSKPRYDFTLTTARMEPFAIEQMELMRALQHNPEAASRFFGVVGAIINPTDFLNPQNLFHILKVGGMARIMLRKIFSVPQQRAS